MKKNYCHLVFVLDRSGSMASIRTDVIGGFNQLLEDQKKAIGDCTVTLVQFDSQNPYEVLRDMVEIEDIKPLGDEYQPRASTPLYDAVGRAIVNTGVELSNLPESERPDKVVFVILTDGYENYSKEYTQEKVKEMIQHQTNVYNWIFIYLGANQDAWLAGQSFGVSGGTSCTYTVGNVGLAYANVSDKLAVYRNTGSGAACNFNAADRRALTK